MNAKKLLLIIFLISSICSYGNIAYIRIEHFGRLQTLLLTLRHGGQVESQQSVMVDVG